MRLAIMQPYFVPYIGYFQLMSAVDKIVLLDDVNFINGGWINRNRIAVHGEPDWLTLPLAKASQNRLINEIKIVDDPLWKKKAIRTVELSYQSAPFANQILPLLLEMLGEARGSLSDFLLYQLRRLTDYIGIATQIELASARYPKNTLTGQRRILDICVREGASIYVNLPGGKSLYDGDLFAATGIELLFLDPNLPGLTLRHSGREGPCLSILDLLMLNPVAAVREATEMFRLSPN
jgi:WbqC-like protein family